VDLVEVGQLREAMGVTEGHEDDSVVGKGGHGGEGGRLLSSAQARSGNENTGVLPGEASRCPETPSGVDECLPLSGEVTVSGGNAKEVGIEGSEIGGGDQRVIRLGRSVHFREDLLRERFGDLVDRDLSTGALNATLDCLSHFGNVAVQRVDDDCDSWRRHVLC